MVTGIEIAGLVLAVTPLCITAVEHHSETFRPVITLFRHRVQHRRRLRDLGVCLVRLEQTLTRILEVSGIANGTNVTHFSDACVSRLWIDRGEEARIIAHFGVKVYKLSFEVIMERIQEDLEEIRSILGLLNGDTSAGAEDTMWSRVMEVSDGLSSPQSRPVVRGLSSSFRERASFVMRSGSLGKYSKRLKDHTHELSEIASFAGQQAMQVQGDETSSRKPESATSLRNIKNHAERLHTALQDFRLCKTHLTHCINLQLGQALPTGTDRDVAAFNIAFASDAGTQTWSALNVCVPAETEDVTAYNNNNSRVKFRLDPPSLPATAPLTASHDICAHVKQCNTGATSTQFHINEHGQIVLWKGASPATSAHLTAQQRESVKSFVHRQHDGDRKMTTEQTMNLGLIVVSTFLRLSTTQWVPDTWCSEDIFFLKPKDYVDVEQTYVSIECTSTTSVGSLGPRTVSDDSSKLLRLGVILLEISAQKTIEDVRLGIKDIADVNFSTDLGRDFTTIREFVKSQQGNMLPCFQTAIDFCIKAYAGGALNLEQQVERQEVISRVLCPFERNLQFWRSPCI